MAMIVGLIFAVILAVAGYKKGLYFTWSLAFNIIVAIYLGIMLGQWTLQTFGEYLILLGTAARAITPAAISIVYFCISQTLAWYYFTGTFCVSIPNLFDKFGAAAAGFGSGYAVGNYLIFLLAIGGFSTVPYIGAAIPPPSQLASNRAVLNACRVVRHCSLQIEIGRCAQAMKILSEYKYVSPKAGESDETIDADRPQHNLPDANIVQPNDPNGVISEPDSIKVGEVNAAFPQSHAYFWDINGKNSQIRISCNCSQYLKKFL